MGGRVNYSSHVLNFRHVIVARPPKTSINVANFAARFRPLANSSPSFIMFAKGKTGRGGGGGGEKRGEESFRCRHRQDDASSDPNTPRVYDRSSPSLKCSINPLSRSVLEYRNEITNGQTVWGDLLVRGIRIAMMNANTNKFRICSTGRSNVQTLIIFREKYSDSNYLNNDYI